MKKIKMSVNEKNLLKNKEMSSVVGGACGCGCFYANNGGSSSADNSAANVAGNKHSPGMQHVTWFMHEDGTWSPCDFWR